MNLAHKCPDAAQLATGQRRRVDGQLSGNEFDNLYAGFVLPKWFGHVYSRSVKGELVVLHAGAGRGPSLTYGLADAYHHTAHVAAAQRLSVARPVAHTRRE
ncbi:hypothetical protein GCM10027417_19430 [Glutamicibacter endophyticus]